MFKAKNITLMEMPNTENILSTFRVIVSFHDCIVKLEI